MSQCIFSIVYCTHKNLTLEKDNFPSFWSDIQCLSNFLEMLKKRSNSRLHFSLRLFQIEPCHLMKVASMSPISPQVFIVVYLNSFNKRVRWPYLHLSKILCKFYCSRLFCLYTISQTGRYLKGKKIRKLWKKEPANAKPRLHINFFSSSWNRCGFLS